MADCWLGAITAEPVDRMPRLRQYAGCPPNIMLMAPRSTSRWNRVQRVDELHRARRRLFDRESAELWWVQSIRIRATRAGDCSVYAKKGYQSQPASWRERVLRSTSVSIAG